MIGGFSALDDWTVLRDRREVGRVFLRRPIGAEEYWQWHANEFYAMGHAATLEEGLECLRSAILKHSSELKAASGSAR